MEALADIDVAKREFHIGQRVMHEPSFGTSDGRAHFVVTPVPPAPAADFPLTLATVRSEGQFNTMIYEERDSYRHGAKRDTVMLNREDMVTFGLSAGDRITLRSPNGTMDAEVMAFDLPRGSALAYYPEANVLSGTAVDPGSRTPAFKSIPITIEPAIAAAAE
jgi:anaerobic selenocysteine-containing dehydrogenase